MASLSPKNQSTGGWSPNTKSSTGSNNMDNRPNEWRKCSLCVDGQITFKYPADFCRHLREHHCTKEGGSFVCRYGQNGVCPTLPLEGVSDNDYEVHVARHHAFLSEVSASASTVPLTPTSTAPSVVTDQHKWTIYNATQNLPAVLNDPRKLKRESDFFKKTWGEGFEKTDILPSPFVPEITRAHFERYLKRTVTKLKKHKKLHENLIDNDSSQQRGILNTAHHREKNKVDLESVPKLFLKPDFALETPEVFNAVLPWSQFSQPKDTSPNTRSSSKLLQEKLSHYLDTVEVQIARQISFRSEAFFSAMTSHDELQEHLTKTCRAIRQLREKVNKIDAILVKGSLEILQLQISRSNYVKVYNKLKLMATVHQTQPTIQLLLSTSEFVGALDLISTTQEVLSQELVGIQSFRHLGSQLAEIEKLIDKMMEEDMSRYTMEEVNRPLDDVLVFEEDRLSTIVLGMLRKHKFNFLEVYREEAATAVKAVVKQTVVHFVASNDDVDSESNNTISLADQMRSLNFEDWMILFRQVFENLVTLLNRTKNTLSVIRRVVTIAAGRSENESNAESSVATNNDNCESSGDVLIDNVECNKLCSNLRELLSFLCDYANDRCVKLLLARSKDGFLEKLTSTEFLNLSRAIELFVNDCEGLCGRRSTSLRGSLQNQASKFVNRFHEERRTKLSLILESERWKQSDVPAEFQDLVNTIAENGNLAGAFVMKSEAGSEERKPGSYLEINGQKYAVVGTVLLLLKMIIEYCQCLDDMPSAVPDILTRLIEILQNFNSRTCQLVLGAGALQLVGLKTITTKNLGCHPFPRYRYLFRQKISDSVISSCDRLFEIVFFSS
ncbi:vacuolar protein sorting-associated protein 54-like isoform X2 [Ptychodera flava]|uniref:vacuolar protein sorting-associated protein 54-like isoform X2 n=1 Tax=Ptychodera flava TaxID=63121 RepID=UPI00396A9B3F